MSINDGDKYRSLQEHAERTGLSYYFLRAAVLSGELPHIKSGVKYLIRDSALNEFLTKKEQENER